MPEHEIAAGLRKMEIGEGHLLGVHSSLKSIGHVEGGGGAVVDALLAVLGVEGTLVVPTFSFTYTTRGDPGAIFDPVVTPSGVGAITESVRRHPRCYRSLHPTHSVSAIGPLAGELTRDHLSSTPIGIGSPFDRFRLRGGTILMVGCRLNRCSIVHLYEALAGVHYLDVTFREGCDHELAAIARDGKRIAGVQPYEPPGCSEGFNAAEPLLEAAGVLKRGTLGNASCLIFNAYDAGETLCAELQNRPDLLLCHRPECNICPRRRTAVQAAG